MGEGVLRWTLRVWSLGFIGFGVSGLGFRVLGRVWGFGI